MGSKTKIDFKEFILKMFSPFISSFNHDIFYPIKYSIRQNITIKKRNNIEIPPTITLKKSYTHLPI